MTAPAGGRVCVHLLVLAGGRGLRAGGGPDATPKQFRATARGPLFTVSLRSLLRLEPARGFAVATVTVTVPEPWRQVASAALGDLAVPWALAPAGPTRTASTFNALSVLAAGHLTPARPAPDPAFPAPGPLDLVAIHDAARPFATADLLQRLAEAAAWHGGAVPGVPLSDTVVEVGPTSEASPHGPARYLGRSGLMAVQTPQVFRWDPCWEAHRWAAAQGADFTDDGGLLALRGAPPVVIPGDQENWKVTTEADWLRARDILIG